jgi:hypothetical protein
MMAVKGPQSGNFAIPAPPEVRDQHIRWKVTVKRSCLARICRLNDVVAHFHQREPKLFPE